MGWSIDQERVREQGAGVSASGSWHPVVFASGLRARRLMPVSLHGTPLILFRDGSGPRLFEDRCPHRGYPLSEGRLEGGHVRCGYHGWHFDGDGACVEVPALVGACAGDGASRRASVRLVRESSGVIWTWAGGGEPPEGPPACDVAAGPGALTLRWTATLDAPLADVAENILDVPHTSFLHGGIFRRPGRGHVVDVRVRRGESQVEAEFIGEPAPSGLLGLLLALALTPRGNEARDRPVHHADRFMMPGIAQVEYGLGERLALRATTFLSPWDSRTTRTLHALSVAPRAAALLAFPLLAPLAGLLLLQDARALRRQSANVARFPEARPVSTEADVLGPHLRQMLERAARGEAPLPPAEWSVKLRT